MEHSRADEKFEKEDLPKIHAALETARKANAATRVIVDFTESGGIISILMESKRKFK